MRISEFEDLASRKGLRIEQRVPYLDKEIFIAEGYSKGDRDEVNPHYKTMYAISDGPEHLTVGEFFTTPILFPIKQKDDRLKEAETRAREFLDGMRAEV